jgi:hypothetical protein
MARILRATFAMIILFAGWTAILWFVVKPNFGQWSIVRTTITHILPPLNVWIAWLLWRHAVKRKEEVQARSREKQAQAEQEAALEEARGKRTAELRQRRFACDCRAIAVSHLVVNDTLKLPSIDQVLFHPIPADQALAGSAADELMDGLEEAVAGALRHIYAKCAAAAVLPLYVVPPNGISFQTVLRRIRVLHRRVADELALPITFKDDVPSVRYLAIGEGAANTVIDLFDAIPDLPGAVIISFDSPLLGGAADSKPEHSGKPSHGAFALLVTHTELPAMLAQLDGRTDVELRESLTPYWQTGAQMTEHFAMLNMLSAPLVSGLRGMPVLGRIHRSAYTQTSPAGAMELTRLAQTLIDRAQVNAALEDLPAIGDAKEPAADKPAASCAWLVHNAGGTATAGSRLAAVMTAMSHFGFELLPFTQATNSVAQVGNLDSATPLCLLALTLVQVAAQQEPAMYAEFASPSRLAVGFVMPVPA